MKERRLARSFTSARSVDLQVETFASGKANWHTGSDVDSRRCSFFASVRVFNARSGSVGVSHERGKHERKRPETLDWQVVARKNNVRRKMKEAETKQRCGMRLAPPQPSHHLKVELPWDGSQQPFQTGEPLQGHRVIRRATRFPQSTFSCILL